MQITRRIVLAMSCCLALPRLLWAQAGISLPSTGDVPGLDLQEQLEKGLRARRQVEFAFIERVIGLIDEGKLPRRIVESTFVWARRQRRPFQSFEYGLRARTKNLDITL